MKLANYSVACGLIACSSMAFAGGSWSGNVAITSDYVFRGISQSDSDPALSFGADYTWDAAPNSFYVGAWASSIDFDDNNEGVAEIDLFAGYKRSIGKAVVDLGLYHFEYPSTKSSLNYDFNELSIGVNYKIGHVKYSYSDDYFGGTGHSHYFEAGLDFELLQEISLGIHAGSMDIERAANYDDWKVGLSREISGIGFEISYTDTDLSTSECVENWCDGRFILTISKVF